MKECSDDGPSHVSLDDRAGRSCMPPQYFFKSLESEISEFLGEKTRGGDEEDPVGVGRLLVSWDRCSSFASSCWTLCLSHSISSEASVSVDALGAPLLLHIRSVVVQFEQGTLLSHFLRRSRHSSHALATWTRLWRRDAT